MEDLNTSRKRGAQLGDPQMTPKKRPQNIPKVNYQNINPKFRNFWETEIFQKYLIIKPKEETNDLIGISPFKLGRELGIHGTIQNIKKQNY